MAAIDQVRLLVVEDVPQVGQYIRSLLNSQQQIKLLDVMSDGSKVAAQIAQLRPDVVIVDALLQGRVKGPALIGQLHAAKQGVPVIVLTVPQKPIEPDPENGVHAVLSMPFSGYDLISRIHAVMALFQEAQAAGNARLISVFAPKGGVGTTTIALNLAVAFGQAGRRTALIDGSLQFGDLRALLRVPDERPVDRRPADRSDRRDRPVRRPVARSVGDRHPARPAAHRAARDDQRPRPRQDPVAHAPGLRHDRDRHDGRPRERTLALLDASDTVIEIVTFDSTTIHNTLVMADTFRSLGYEPTKVHYLVNRADSAGGIDEQDLAGAIGRMPEHRVVSDGMLVVQSNNEGVPFVLAEPTARSASNILRTSRNQLMALDRAVRRGAALR